MEVLERQKSWKLLTLEALVKRLPENDGGEFSFYKDMHVSQRKGYGGEVCVDQMWNEMNIPNPYYLFHGFETVNHAGNSHQIDTICLTPQFIWLLEIKDIGGRIDIDESKHQMIRTKQEGLIESFKNPIDQVKRHAEFVKRKLRDFQLNLPVEYAVIFVSDYTIIGSIPKGAPIFHASGLQTELDKLFNKHRESSLSSPQLEKLKIELLNMHQCKQWKAKVDVRRLRKGVLCKSCDYKSVMKYEHGSFKCVKCGFKCKAAYVEALSDYRYLFGEWISNQGLRDYLGVESRHAIKRIIQKINLEQTGTFRNRKYRIPDFLSFDHKNNVESVKKDTSHR